jgi:hypothetical protein
MEQQSKHLQQQIVVHMVKYRRYRFKHYFLLASQRQNHLPVGFMGDNGWSMKQPYNVKLHILTEVNCSFRAKPEYQSNSMPAILQEDITTTLRCLLSQEVPSNNVSTLVWSL